MTCKVLQRQHAGVLSMKMTPRSNTCSQEDIPKHPSESGLVIDKDCPSLACSPHHEADSNAVNFYNPIAFGAKNRGKTVSSEVCVSSVGQRGRAVKDTTDAQLN